MRDADTAKLILKLIALMGVIWGLGWILYENTFLGNHFTASNYQNILLVLMSATWLILLVGAYGKEPQKKQHKTIYIKEPETKPLPNITAKTKQNPTPPTKKRSIVKELLAQYNEHEDSS